MKTTNIKQSVERLQAVMRETARRRDCDDLHTKCHDAIEYLRQAEALMVRGLETARDRSNVIHALASADALLLAATEAAEALPEYRHQVSMAARGVHAAFGAMQHAGRATEEPRR